MEASAGRRSGRPQAHAPVDYRHLPEPVDPDRVIASHDPGPEPPDGIGRDPELDFILRYLA